ncbi:MAG: porin [Bacteroides sp.]|nr:porin [Bacteroides sp.]MCM1413375.1 porin [Bacteroides sp.]MCM1471939.1 porin [Bacteroides sp.]
MKSCHYLMLAAAMLGGIPSAYALKPKQYSDTVPAPERAIIVSGDRNKASALMQLLYDQTDLHFTEPSAPRFLFLDREGKVAFGIGGYVKGTLQYDFGGAIDDGASFTTYDIPVPNDPGQRNQFYGNANHSTIFLQLVGKTERFGYYQMYLQTQFSGNGTSGYGLKLKQAYLKVGYVTAGLTNSTFVDGSAGTPVIDDQGPAGEVSNKNILVRYAPRFSDHFSGAISVEAPKASVTILEVPEGVEPTLRKINQRVPDIPIYVQYEWGKAANHVRLSGLFRDLSYRDLITQRNKFAVGWAVQLSGHIEVLPKLTLLYQGAYGRGYGQYLNDLQGEGFDLVQSTTPGKMRTPRMSNYELGLRYDFTSKLFATASYSQVRVYGTRDLGPDSYRYGQYISVSGFYNLYSDLRIGFEYLHGKRMDQSGIDGRANRIMGMINFSF